MTTNEAFKQLSSQRGWYKLCGINQSTATSFKNLFKQNKLSQNKIFELLKKAGYAHPKIVWKKPNQKP